MTQTYDVAIIVGSLRRASVNRKAAEALTRLAPTNLSFRFVEIGDLPLYNEDVEEAGILQRQIPHDDWEVEACHYAV